MDFCLDCQRSLSLSLNNAGLSPRESGALLWTWLELSLFFVAKAKKFTCLLVSKDVCRLETVDQLRSVDIC